MGVHRTDRRELEAAISRAVAQGRLADATTCALNAYRDEIRRYLLRLLRHEDDAAEAFARFAEHVWRGLPAFRGTSSFRTWAYGVARRCAIDLRRRPRPQRLETAEALQLPGAVA